MTINKQKKSKNEICPNKVYNAFKDSTEILIISNSPLLNTFTFYMNALIALLRLN